MNENEVQKTYSFLHKLISIKAKEYSQENKIEELTTEVIALRNGKRRGFIDGAVFMLTVLSSKDKSVFGIEGNQIMAVYKLIYKTKDELKKEVMKAYKNSKTPIDFERWLSENDGKFYVENEGEEGVTPYTSSELFELI